LDFYKQEVIEVDGEWYISVKGTAKSYKKTSAGIRYQIDIHPEIFDNHIIDLKKDAKKEKLFPYFSKEQLTSHGKWLDKFAFYKIGILLNSSPKTIPIKAICFLNKE